MRIVGKDCYYDVFVTLKRTELDVLQISYRPYRSVIKSHMQGVCLRALSSLALDKEHDYHYKDTFVVRAKQIQDPLMCVGGGEHLRYDGVGMAFAGLSMRSRLHPMVQDKRTKDYVRWEYDSYEEAFKQFVNVSRSSVALECRFFGRFTQKFFKTWEALQAAGHRFDVRKLELANQSAFFNEKEDYTVQAMAFHVFKGVKSIVLDNAIRCRHLTDDLLKACVENGVSSLKTPKHQQIGEYCEKISEGGILDFCFGSIEGANGIGDRRELELSTVKVKADFFKKIVQAHRECPFNHSLTAHIVGPNGRDQNTEGFEPALKLSSSYFNIDLPGKPPLSVALEAGFIDVWRGNDVTEHRQKVFSILTGIPMRRRWDSDMSD